MKRNSIMPKLIFLKNLNKEYKIISKNIPPSSSAINIYLSKKYSKIMCVEKSYLNTFSKINYNIKEYIKYSKVKKNSKSKNEINYCENKINSVLDSLDNSANMLEKKLNILGSLNTLYLASHFIECHMPPEKPIIW